MANSQRRQRVAACILISSMSQFASAQETTGIDVPATATSSNPDATATEPTAPTTDVPLQLWSIANSLLSTYYPSTSISDIATLTWPSVVVIESSTYTHSAPESSAVSPTTTPTSFSTVPASSQDVSRPLATDTSNSSETGSQDEASKQDRPKDRTLGIALGVVFGVLAVAVMIFALCCIDRRQKKHGGKGLFPSRRRRATSPTDSEVGAWRARHPHMGLVSTMTRPMSQVHNRQPREWVDRYNRLADQQTPPAHMHPAFLQQNADSTGTAAETNPFFAPTAQPSENANRQNEQQEYHPGYPKPGFNVDVVPYTPYRPNARRSHSSRRRSTSSLRSIDEEDETHSRPPTPFSPMMMLQTSLPPHQANNPFTSDDDEDAAQRQRLTQREPETYEADDVVHPIQAPLRSPARRYSPLVHYPSWSEVSEFDFTGESDLADQRVRAQRSRGSVDDGYGRDRESVVGRLELA